jgi:hypothetical protein
MSENATGVGHIHVLGFLTPGNFADDDPYTGLEATLQLFEDAEKAGWDGILFPVDLIGTTDEILEHLAADPVVARVTELRVEVPYEFEKHEYEQILHDVRYNLAPQLGWTPSH